MGLYCSNPAESQWCVPEGSGCGLNCGNRALECYNQPCPPAIGTDCCWHCNCKEQDMNQDCPFDSFWTDTKCCRCGDFDCYDINGCSPPICPDGAPNQMTDNIPSDCFCGICACNGGPCNPQSNDSLYCEPCLSGNLGPGTNALVKLPDGRCVWMMCEHPFCPYPPCDD